MTAHKSQGQTMHQAIIDLQSCHGTESPYVMLSRVTSLEGLAILRPFEKRKIQCRQSEDSRREAKRLHLLQLHTVQEHGDEKEGDAIKNILSRSQHYGHIACDVDAIDTVPLKAAQQLQDLQNTNYQLTSGPTIPNLFTEDNGMVDVQHIPCMMLNFYFPLFFLCITFSLSTVSYDSSADIATINPSKKRKRTECNIRSRKHRKSS
jgi:hypothetical protein